MRQPRGLADARRNVDIDVKLRAVGVPAALTRKPPRRRLKDHGIQSKRAGTGTDRLTTWRSRRAKSIWVRKPSRWAWRRLAGPRCCMSTADPRTLSPTSASGAVFRASFRSLRALRRAGRNSAQRRVRPDLPAGRGRFRADRTVHYCAGNGNRVLSRRQSVA
jgi:hypothetical protein